MSWNYLVKTAKSNGGKLEKLGGLSGQCDKASNINSQLGPIGDLLFCADALNSIQCALKTLYGVH